jgi:hypothetical protein
VGKRENLKLIKFKRNVVRCFVKMCDLSKISFRYNIWMYNNPCPSRVKLFDSDIGTTILQQGMNYNCKEAYRGGHGLEKELRNLFMFLSHSVNGHRS